MRLSRYYSACGYRNRPFSLIVRLSSLAVFSLSVSIGSAATDLGDPSAPLGVRASLEAKYPGARVEISNWSSNCQQASVPVKNDGKLIRVDIDPRGGFLARFSGVCAGAPHEWSVAFRVFMRGWTVTERVPPGTALASVQPGIKEFDLSVPTLRDLQSLMISADQDLSRMETKQTLLPDQPILSSTVRRVFDLRKNEPLRVDLISGGLRVSTSGQADEPGYEGEVVRITTLNTKRQLSGILRPNGVVEVRL